MALFAGDLLQGRYRIASPLGQGGMGTVYLARDEATFTLLVVKQLRLDAPELLDSFRGEFALLSRLTHPHLVRVLALGSERVRGERLEDLPALSTKILAALARSAKRKPPELSQEALRKLSAHRFPGNVRELQNVLTRAFVLATGPQIRAEDLDVGAARARAPRAQSRRDFESQERERILDALRGARWNVSIVARSLGIPRNTLYRKLARYGLKKGEA